MGEVDLHGRVAVITGAASGIGRATALLLGSKGARLHLADLDGDGVEAVAAEVRTGGGQAAAHVLSTSPDAQAVEAFAEQVFASARAPWTCCTTTPASATARTSRRRRTRTGSA